MNIQELFKDLKFDEIQHRYFLNDKELISVSKKIKIFYQEFDIRIAKIIAEKRGVSEKEILQEWENKRKNSSDRGTDIHLFAEQYANYKSLNTKKPILDIDDKFFLEKAMVKKFYDEQSEILQDYGSEIKVYSNKYEFAGTIDKLWYNPHFKGVIIDDYKTNESLYKQYKNQKLLDPFSQYDDIPLNKYALQLSHYGLALEEAGLEVLSIRIIHITKDNYEIKILPNLSKELKQYYENIRNNTKNPIFI